MFQNHPSPHDEVLSEMEEDQTLVMYSGHPMGLFLPGGTRVVVNNGMVIPNYSQPTIGSA